MKRHKGSAVTLAKNDTALHRADEKRERSALSGQRSAFSGQRSALSHRFLRKNRRALTKRASACVRIPHDPVGGERLLEALAEKIEMR
jgi:hypothetical protein